MKKINSKLKELDYDYIIYDVPPIQGLSDPLLVGENVDGVILLLSLDNIKKNIFKEALLKLQEKDLNLLGIISNYVKKKQDNKSNNTYGYSSYFNI